MIALHTESKVTSSDNDKFRSAMMVARSAFGVTRLMPIIHRYRIIGWCGWSQRENVSYVFHHLPWMNAKIDQWGQLCGWTSVDDLINEVTVNGKMRQILWFKVMEGAIYSGWNHLHCAGYFPNAGDFTGTSYTARQRSDSDQGAPWHGGNVSTDTKHIVSAWSHTIDTAANGCVYVIYDMVLTYDNCTAVTGSPQSFTNTLTPQRYISGAGAPGLQIMGCMNTTSVGNGYNSLAYTTIGGASGQESAIFNLFVNFNSVAPSSVAPAMTCLAAVSTNTNDYLTLPLNNGDVGVTQLDSFYMTSGNTDAYNFILGFPLAWIPAYSGLDYTYAIDFVKQAPALPRVYDGACLSLAVLMAINAGFGLQAGATVAWG